MVKCISQTVCAGLIITVLAGQALTGNVSTVALPQSAVLRYKVTAQEYFERGLQRQKQQDFQGAIADFTETLHLAPNHKAAYFHRGIAQSRLGDYNRAIDDLSIAIRLAPNLAAAYYERGKARLKLGDYRGAIADYDKAIQIRPELTQLSRYKDYTLTARRQLHESGNPLNEMGTHRAPSPTSIPVEVFPQQISTPIAIHSPQTSTSPPLTTSVPDVYKIANQTTVLIDGQQAGSGSGVIISKVGSTYYVLTSKHVVDKPSTYVVTTSSGKTYSLDYNQIKKMDSLDLAVVQFNSKEMLPFARIGNSNQINQGDSIYISGWPEVDQSITKHSHLVTEGRIAGIQPGNKDGYELMYSNPTGPGMSGGPIFDRNGQVIGIHGRAAGNKTIGKIGINLGIPIHLFLNQVTQIGLNLKPLGFNAQK